MERVFVNSLQEQIYVALPANTTTITVSAQNAVRFAAVLDGNHYVQLSLAQFDIAHQSWSSGESVHAISIAGNVLTVVRSATPISFAAGYFLCAGLDASDFASIHNLSAIASNVEQIVVTVQADSARAKVDAAEAVITANTASTDADNAVTTANLAKSDAATAKADAAAAKSDATTAKADAAAAKSDSALAVQTANLAKSDATTAKSDAATAVQTANAAYDTATGIAATAGEALTTAGTAIRIAQSAVSGTEKRFSLKNDLGVFL